MALEWRLVTITLFCLNIGLNEVHCSQDLMKQMSASFFKVVEECKKEVGASDATMESLTKFWNADHELTDRDIGCVILCMANKHDLIEIEEYKMHQEKSIDFAKNHGADESTARQVVTVIHECEKKNADVGDHCMRMLEVAKCFRIEMHKLNWAPSVEVVVEEIISEM